MQCLKSVVKFPRTYWLNEIFSMNKVLHCYTKSPISKLSYLVHNKLPLAFYKTAIYGRNLPNILRNTQNQQLMLSERRFSDDVTEPQLKRAMDELTDKFTEARELMEDARESKGTVYFSEDVVDAQVAVQETLTEYQTLLNKVSNKQRQQVMRTIGLRMEELKAQLTAMEEELKED